MNAMLLNEFLKEHRKVEQQEATIGQLKKQIESVVAHSKEQDVQIQRVRNEAKINRQDARLVLGSQ